MGSQGGRVATGQQQKRHWTDAEIDVLCRSYGRCDLAELAAQLGRSPLAVKKKAERLAVKQYSDGDLTALDVATILGRDRATIRRWLESGRLKGTRGPNERAGNPFWHVKPAELRAFIKRHPTEASERMDREWFVRIVAGLPAGKSGSEAC